MVAVEFNWAYYTLLVFISALVPGLAVGWPLLKKTNLSKLERLLFCFFIGLVVPPAMLVLENMAGVQFSLFLALANIFVLTAGGVFWGIREGAFHFSMPSANLEDFLSVDGAKKHLPTLLLLIAVLLAFWIRLQSFSPVYSELDPYFYVYGSGQIIREGQVPYSEDTAWWPEVRSAGHRAFPSLKMYIEAQGYALYTGGGGYNNYLLFDTSSWLPPIMAALMAFGGYLLFSSHYGKRYGLLAAFLLTFLPVTIFKMSAGVNEAGPEGMASIFIVLGFYALALRKNDLRLGALAALGFFTAVAASNYEPVIAIPVAGFIALQALDYFIRGKKNEGFLRISACLVAGFLAGSFVDSVYPTGIGGLPGMFSNPQVLLCVGALALAYALEKLDVFTKMPKGRKTALLALAVLAAVLVLLVPNPAGRMAKDEVHSFIGAADFNFPLQRTIAEQNDAGSSFEGESGFLALVPKGRIVAGAPGILQAIANPSYIPQVASNAVYSVLDLFAGFFTWIGNFALKLSSSAFNFFLGTNISPGTKDPSLLFVFAIIGTLGLAWNHFSREGEERNAPSLAVLLLILTLPILYIGLNKIKFTIFIGMALVVVAVATLAELERLALRLAGKKEKYSKHIKPVFIAAIVLLALGEVFLPSAYSLMILSKSFETRYQDSPAAAMPHLADVCEELRSRGYYDADICAAGYNTSFAGTINSQFNTRACLVSQLSVQEIFPTADAASQNQASEARSGASFRCNRLADYWVDSMLWIRSSVPEGDRITSWWDYGHWINYFGDHKTVLRNEHASLGMIGRVAHDYILGTTQDLITSMNYFDSRYVLFDVELIGGDSFGGKYGALNYLGCAHEGETSVKQAPGTSKCEFDHSPERIVVPKLQGASSACVLSESQQRAGVLAYRIGQTAVDSTPAYCIGEITLGGKTVPATYYLDRKDSNGDMVLSKGIMRQIDDNAQYATYEMVYTDAPIWPGPAGTLVGGMEDAKNGFYTSNLYRGFYLGHLPGFDLVYKSANGEVKIYRMQNFTGNPSGWIDPVASKQTQ